MKSKINKAYDILDEALSTACGSWKTLAEVYDEAMVEVMEILRDVASTLEDVERRN